MSWRHHENTDRVDVWFHLNKTRHPATDFCNIHHDAAHELDALGSDDLFKAGAHAAKQHLLIPPMYLELSRVVVPSSVQKNDRCPFLCRRFHGQVEKGLTFLLPECHWANLGPIIIGGAHIVGGINGQEHLCGSGQMI